MGSIWKTLMPKVLCWVVKGVVICASLFVVFLFLLLCTKVDIIGFLERSFGGDHSLPMLNISVHHTPIVIVDEHSEVIPYWYKAVEEGLLQTHGNTLIHFDAHSDMATPNSYSSIMSTHPLKEHDFLPLMQTHDGYIMSAIMKKLINTVIWVKPNWLNNTEPNSTITTYDAFVGTAGIHNEVGTTVCTCKRKHRRNKHGKRHHKHFHCSYVTGKDGEERKVVKIPQSTCPTINRNYRYIVLNEMAFINLMAKQMKKKDMKDMKKLLKNTIIDVDEDYFSIESDAHRLIKEGMESHKLAKIDQTLGYLYCPETVKKEEDLHHKLRHLVKRLSKLNSTKLEEYKKLLQSTQKYFCDNDVNKDELLNEFVEYFSALPQKQLQIMRTARFCLLHSPRLKNLPVHFGICQYNYTYPEDRNILHHASNAEIKARSQRLANILRYVSKYGKVNMFTVARSLRDGSTPIDLWRGIEKRTLYDFEKVLKENGQDAHVVHDRHLMYGKDGR